MGRSKRYVSNIKKDKAEEEREEKALSLLEQKKMSGRLPIPPPGKFHDSDGKQQRRARKAERNRLNDLKKEFNRG